MSHGRQNKQTQQIATPTTKSAHFKQRAKIHRAYTRCLEANVADSAFIEREFAAAGYCSNKHGADPFLWAEKAIASGPRACDANKRQNKTETAGADGEGQPGTPNGNTTRVKKLPGLPALPGIVHELEGKVTQLETAFAEFKTHLAAGVKTELIAAVKKDLIAAVKEEFVTTAAEEIVKEQIESYKKQNRENYTVHLNNRLALLDTDMREVIRDELIPEEKEAFVTGIMQIVKQYCDSRFKVVE